MITLVTTPKLRESMEYPYCDECSGEGYLEHHELYDLTDLDCFEEVDESEKIMVLLNENSGFILATCPFCEGTGRDEEGNWE